jgi:GT2 family glycosyltransferase
MRIGIVILNWNGRSLLERFLPSVVAHSQEAKIYVADNASTDDSIDLVRSRFPSVAVIENTENWGFAKGYNEALKRVHEDIICLLNNDVEVTPNWLDPVISRFKAESNTVIMQPKLLDHKRRNYFEYAGAAGGYVDKYGYPYCRGRIFNTVEKDKGQYDDVADIHWASGACLFIRNEIFHGLKGFDESFFAHMEEIDLCWRAKNMGYDIKYAGASEVYHLGGATLNHKDPRKTYLNFRNSLFTLVKNSVGPLFPIVFARLFLDGVACIKFLTELKFKHLFAVLRSHWSFYGHLSTVLRWRKASNKGKSHYMTTSIVWSYYVLNKRTFNSL